MLHSIAQRLQQWGFSRAGLLDNRHGEWWLLAQLLLIAAHALPATPPPAALGLSWPPALRLVGGLLLLIGLVSAGRSAVNLGASLTPLPEPMPTAPLVTTGAYGRCRHPLYRAVLLCSLGLTVALGSLLHLGLLLLLALVLRRKACLEEQRLCALRPDYASYAASVPALVPFLPGLDWPVSPPAAAGHAPSGEQG